MRSRRSCDVDRNAFQFGDGAKEETEQESSEENSEETRDMASVHRCWALDMLYQLVMSVPSFDPMQLIRVLLATSCFQVENDTPARGLCVSCAP